MVSVVRAVAISASAVALHLAMSGCGADGTPNGQAVSGEETSAPAPFAWSPTPQRYRTLSQQELAAALLDQSDLPANYIVAPSAPNWLDRRFCNEQSPRTPAVQASAAYLKHRAGPGDVTRTNVRVYPTKAEATASFEALKTAVQGCRQEAAGGRTYQYAVVQLPTANRYSTVIIRVTADGVTTMQGFVTSGPALVTVEMGELTPAGEWKNGMTAEAHDTGRLLQLLEKQMSHYKSAADCAYCD